MATLQQMAQEPDHLRLAHGGRDKRSRRMVARTSVSRRRAGLSVAVISIIPGYRTEVGRSPTRALPP